MTVQDIVDKAVYETHVQSDSLTAARTLESFNIRRKELSRIIMQRVQEDFFYEKWKRDAFSTQNNGEYLMAEADQDSDGTVKIQQVNIKNKATDTNFTRASRSNEKDLTRPWDWYLTNQSVDVPTYFIAGQSIFIAPQATAANIFVDLDLIVTSVAWADGAETLAAQPTYPRNLKLVLTDADASVSSGDIVVVGTDVDGDALNETISISSSVGTQTITSSNIFNTVTSVTSQNVVGATAADTITVGIGEDGNRYIELIGYKKFIDLELSDTDEKILIPDDFQHIISLGMQIDIYKHLGQRSKTETAAQEYAKNINQMVELMTNRETGGYIQELPDDRKLQ